MTLALQASGIRKAYGALVAVEDVRLDLASGEVHVLLGSNGCGKSTLCKIIAGSVAADSGTITLGAKPVLFAGPMEAKAAGIATVYQELSLVPTLTVAQNILLGSEPQGRLGRTDWRKMQQRAASRIASAGPLAERLDPGALVGDLAIDQQQIVEILKALEQKPQIILFDESTSSLDRAQVGAFFDLVRQLKAQGVSIIFISHRMEEIFAIGDRVTVMRNGRTVATLPLAHTARDDLLRLMTGSTVEKPVRARVRLDKAPLLAVTGLTGGKLSNISFTLGVGEILGLGGLHGQGQSNLLLALYGAAIRTSGLIMLDGLPVTNKSPLDALQVGMVYVSGDRARAGIFPGRPILENLVLAKLARRRGFVANRRALARAITPLIDRLKLKFGGFAHAIGTLSGGNQQKVVLGKALAAKPRVLLLDDPTKGIDAQAKRDLYALLRELCEEGAAVILYSSEDFELLDNADRILVFSGGKVLDELAGARLTEFNLYAAALASVA